MKRPYVIGVTGGIGSGKSTVAREFERRGVPVLDADVAAREVVEPGSDGLAALVAEFGTSILGADGALDRGQLRRMVFGDAPRLKRLEEILHPRIRQRLEARLGEIVEPYCLLCIPLLVEKKGYAWIDRVLVVDCPVETQIERVMKRDNLTAAEVAAIMNTQASREARLQRADDVVSNTGEVSRLADRVDELHRRYLDLAAAAARSGH
ncbi:MAG: dephospho-CoA kinase [Gammaproteobacteria bacterium]|nr:dephospho-CoA kinase [Gammaproteobacteria bacterium]MBI5618521.1 dephospho-CoA kinase [Gammaproteobacteria bacterium]